MKLSKQKCGLIFVSITVLRNLKSFDVWLEKRKKAKKKKIGRRRNLPMLKHSEEIVIFFRKSDGGGGYSSQLFANRSNSCYHSDSGSQLTHVVMKKQQPCLRLVLIFHSARSHPQKFWRQQLLMKSLKFYCSQLLLTVFHTFATNVNTLFYLLV